MASCSARTKIFTIGGNSVWKLPGDSAFFFKAGMTIDADGAPNAYHPSDIGIDFLANAGSPGNWFALVTDNGQPDGEPVVQRVSDPFPGFFISTTSLEDTSKDRTDPHKYIDSTKISFIVLPGNSLVDSTGVGLGDYVAVFNGNNNTFSFAIYADIGPEEELGEGSVALSQALGNNPFVHGKVQSGINDNVLYVVFPGSRSLPWSSTESPSDINEKASSFFKAWGDMAQIEACSKEL